MVTLRIPYFKNLSCTLWLFEIAIKDNPFVHDSWQFYLSAMVIYQLHSNDFPGDVKRFSEAPHHDAFEPRRFPHAASP